MTEYWNRGSRIVLDMGCARDKSGKWCILTKSTAMQIEIKANIAFKVIFDIIQMVFSIFVLATSDSLQRENQVYKSFLERQ